MFLGMDMAWHEHGWHGRVFHASALLRRGLDRLRPQTTHIQWEVEEERCRLAGAWGRGGGERTI